MVTHVKQEESEEDVQPSPSVGDSNLVELSAGHAVAFGGFPLGCRVWYNFQSVPGGTELDCCTGTIQSVLMDRVSRKLVFQVEMVTNGHDALGGVCDKVYEGNIAYANGCSVEVQRGSQWVTGEIICAKPTFHNGSVQSIKYDVLLSLEENRVKMAHGIPAEHVKCRTVEGTSNEMDVPAPNGQVTDSAASTGTSDENKSHPSIDTAGVGGVPGPHSKRKGSVSSRPKASNGLKKKRVKQETPSKHSPSGGGTKTESPGQDRLVKRGASKGKSFCHLEKWWFEKACIRFGWGNWELVRTFLPDRTAEECQQYASRVVEKYPGTKERLIEQHKTEWANPGGLQRGTRVTVLCSKDKVWKASILRRWQEHDRDGYSVHYDGLASESAIWVPISKVVEVIPDLTRSPKNARHVSGK